ncbi:MAG TPA: hypothetical protein VMT18_14235, partial [Planctomycetota bacterium]|nr:hypothetical protein [Planctomycetota bacterium]
HPRRMRLAGRFEPRELARSPGMDREDRKRCKGEVMDAFEAARFMLNAWDPLLIQPGGLAPVDEYDRYAFEVVSLVERGGSLDDLYRYFVKLRESTLGMGHADRGDLLFAGRVLSRLRPQDAVRYVIEDEWHGEHSGGFESLEAAVSELERRARLPWDAEPNRAPCTGWHACGRSYFVVAYDAQSEWGRLLSRTALLDVSSEGVRWRSVTDVGGGLPDAGSAH